MPRNAEHVLLFKSLSKRDSTTTLKIYKEGFFEQLVHHLIQFGVRLLNTA